MIIPRAIAAFETVLEVAVLNVNVTEEPVEIEGDDAALILQRVSYTRSQAHFQHFNMHKFKV